MISVLNLISAFQSTWGAFQQVAVQSHCLLIITYMQFNLPQVGEGWAVFMYSLCFLVFQLWNWSSLDQRQLACWIIHLGADRVQTCSHFSWQRSQTLTVFKSLRLVSEQDYLWWCYMSTGFFCLKWKSIIATVRGIPITSCMHPVPLI